MKEKIVIVSGGFDPLHVGHVRYFKEAAKLGDRLVVILNSDEFLLRKKRYFAMSFAERKEILESLKHIDIVVRCIDEDDSVRETLERFAEEFKEYDLIFAKGGDRTIDNILEKDICEQCNIEMRFNVGGEKI